MDYESALSDLTSDVPDVRLKAARFFAGSARTQDVAALRKAQKIENVPWISRALDRAIIHAGEPVVRSADSDPQRQRDDVPSGLVREIRAEAVEEVSGTILHEFSPLVGLIRVQAQAEIPDYQGSKTAKLLAQLSDMMSAVRSLKKAAGVPTYSEFNLSALVRESVDTTGPYEGIDVRYAGLDPFPITADRERLKIVVSNGLRNAREALENASAHSDPRIVINWGRAGAENWLAIIDNGSGFADDPAAALKLGTSTKKDHIGFGLATALQAMQSMEGDLTVSNAAGGGARFELRLYSDANIVRGGQPDIRERGNTAP